MATMTSVNLGDDLFADEAGVDDELEAMHTAAPFMGMDDDNGPMQLTQDDDMPATQEGMFYPYQSMWPVVY